MNPFDLRGPEFLLFYIGLAAATFGVLYAWRRRSEPSPEPGAWMRDPYLIAGLRGGAKEIVTLATFSLLTRGILGRVDGDRVARSNQKRLSPSNALERAVVALVSEPRTVSTIARDRTTQLAAEPYLDTLRAKGLLANDTQRSRRRAAASLAGALLVGVAIVKIGVALSRGRMNIGFLILLSGLCAWGCVAWARTFARTRAGDAVLRDLRTLIGPGRALCTTRTLSEPDPEQLLIAAVGGIYGSPFQPPPRVKTGSVWSSSSCGTSISSCGGGGGCGGGGCGGCGGS